MENDPARFELASRPIVVGTDGSEGAALAVAWAAELAEAVHTELLVVHSLPLMERLPGGERVPADRVRDQVTELVSGAWSAPARRQGVAVRAMVEDGPAVLVLARVAERERASMIVVATRGRGNAPVDTIGSTCHGLVSSSTTPVVTLQA